MSLTEQITEFNSEISPKLKNSELILEQVRNWAKQYSELETTLIPLERGLNSFETQSGLLHTVLASKKNFDLLKNLLLQTEVPIQLLEQLTNFMILNSKDPVFQVIHWINFQEIH